MRAVPTSLVDLLYYHTERNIEVLLYSETHVQGGTRYDPGPILIFTHITIVFHTHSTHAPSWHGS